MSLPQGWWGTDFHVALHFQLLYALLVLVGLYKYKTPPKERPKKAALKTWGDVGSLLSAEPIRIFQMAYNAFQVVFCTYMVASSVQVAVGEGLSLTCNPFDGQSSKVATVHHRKTSHTACPETESRSHAPHGVDHRLGLGRRRRGSGRTAGA